MGSQRNGDLPARSDRGAERREQKSRAKLAYRVYLGRVADSGYTQSATKSLKLCKREQFGKTLNIKEKYPNRNRIVPQYDLTMRLKVQTEQGRGFPFSPWNLSAIISLKSGKGCKALQSGSKLDMG